MDPRRAIPALAALAGLCLVVTAAVTWARSVEGPDTEPANTVTTAGEASDREAPVSPSVRAARVLRDWDARRAAAWASGDASGLSALYAAGSGAGRADVDHLRRWTRRGLVVRGLTTQVLSLRVLDSTADRLSLLVTDRVAGGVAVRRGAAGERSAGERSAPAAAALPVDRASTRVVRLVRRGSTWLVEEAEAHPRAAASTSRTFSSSKS